MPVKPKPLVIDPALLLLEFSSIAAGIQAGDAMVKRSELPLICAGTVQPGHLLILAGGPVAEVEEALKAAQLSAPDAILDRVFLPGVHASVPKALAGGRVTLGSEALGIVETQGAASAIQAADVAVKGADVTLAEVRLADGLGGKGIVLLTGKVSDIEAGIELATKALREGTLVRQVVIAQIHSDIATLLSGTTRFGAQLGWDPA